MSEIIKTLWLIAIAFSLTGIVPCVSAQETAEPMDQATASQELTIDDNTVDLPLESVLLLALKNNLDITFARMQPEAAETDIMREEGQFDPLFSSQFSKYRERKQVANALSGSETSAEIWQERYNLEAGLQKRFTAGTQADLRLRHRESTSDLPFAGLVPEYYSELVLGLTQPLLRDFGIEVGRSFIKIANLNYEVSEQQFRQQVMDVLYQVEAFYWDLYFRISDLENKRKSLERAQDFQRTFRIRIEAGTLAPIEIYQADAEVALRAQEVIVAEARVQQAEDNLKAVLNLYREDRYWDVRFQPTDMPERSPIEPAPAECIEIALENRPEIKQARLGLDISDVQVRYTKNQLMPRLDLFGSIGTNGLSGRNSDVTFGGTTIPGDSPWHGKRNDTLEYMRDLDYYSYEIGIRLEFPLGNRVARSQHTRARIEKIQAATTLESVQNTIITDVREAIRLVETSRKVIDSSSATLRFTQEKLTAEEKKFDVGMSTAFAVLEYQSDLANAESNLAFAYAEHRKALTNLMRVMGILLEEKGLVL
jgi:outer membrane protein